MYFNKCFNKRFNKCFNKYFNKCFNTYFNKCFISILISVSKYFLDKLTIDNEIVK